MTYRKSDIRCQVATTLALLADANMMRTLYFIEEGGHSPEFIFDGNDHQATHFVFYDGDTPIGSLRVRWFAGFAKYERTCFHEKYRNPFNVKRCIQMTFPHVARKGYTKVLTQAEERLAQLWVRLFKMEYVNDNSLVIPGSNELYRTVVGTIPASADPITINSDAALLLKIEGEWDKPGAFEHHW